MFEIESEERKETGISCLIISAIEEKRGEKKESNIYENGI